MLLFMMRSFFFKWLTLGSAGCGKELEADAIFPKISQQAMDDWQSLTLVTHNYLGSSTKMFKKISNKIFLGCGDDTICLDAGN